MKKQKYQSPTLKVLKFKMERGFAGSADGYSFEKNNETGNLFLMEFDENSGPRNEQFDRTNYNESFFN